jgi:predicted ATPase
MQGQQALQRQILEQQRALQMQALEGVGVTTLSS